METTSGTLLGGKVRYAQPRTGHRTGIEPVLLAAAIPAAPGDRVLEAGTGAGAGLLCLGARVPGLLGTGVELDPETAALARGNLAANGLADWVIVEGDIAAPIAATGFGHAFANPPWHDPAGTPSTDALRSLAKRVAGTGLEGWAHALALAVRPGGSVTMIVPGSCMAAGLAALHKAGCGALALMPLWPKVGRDARLVLVQGRRGSRAAGRVLPGIVLHNDDGSYSTMAEAVLRHGTGLRW